MFTVIWKKKIKPGLKFNDNTNEILGLIFIEEEEIAL